MVALIQRPAPTFKAAAVVDGLFEDVSLTDYLGQWYEPFKKIFREPERRLIFFTRVVLFFYPMYALQQHVFCLRRG